VLDTGRRILTRELRRLRKDGRSAVLWSLRVTVAAVASYVVGILLLDVDQPLLAPLTAMLVVQVTPVSLLTTGMDRVVAVVAGVSMAVLFAAYVPLEWWSLGLLIFACITIGQILRLRSNLVEVAISGMLILGVGELAQVAGGQRVVETLVGAAVGIAANLLFPPKVASLDAGRAIDGLADSLSELLNRAANELTQLVPEGDGTGDVAAAARVWLDDARRINHDIPQVGAALLRAEQGRRLNVRAIGTPNVGPGLRQGLEALEHSSVAIRGMFRAVVDASQDATWTDEDTARDVLLGLAQTFRDIAACVDAFGQVVRDEADPAATASSGDLQALVDALQALHEARDRLNDLLVAGGPPQLLELHAAVSSTVKRLLHEMDLGERIRRQVRLRQARRRGRPGPPPPSGSRPTTPSEPAPDADTELLPQLPPRRRNKPRS
jgi:uncharacterized membrane protein YccC